MFQDSSSCFLWKMKKEIKKEQIAGEFPRLNRMIGSLSLSAPWFIREHIETNFTDVTRRISTGNRRNLRTATL